MHNAQLEDILRALEKEVGDVRDETEQVNRERKRAQEDGRAEVEGLGSEWKRAVRGTVECLIAVDEMGREILGERREGRG